MYKSLFCGKNRLTEINVNHNTAELNSNGCKNNQKKHNLDIISCKIIFILYCSNK